MRVFAFEYCSCIYESAFGIESMHTTKKGAYKAMRKFLLKEWEKFKESDLYEKDFRRQCLKDKPEVFSNNQFDRRFKFMCHESVRVKEYIVVDDQL